MLTDEDFLRAIRANPADEAPWLMYADWLSERGHPDAELYRQRYVTNAIGMRLVLIPPGTFLMGSPDDEEDRLCGEGPQHEVAITRPFYLGVYPVTQRQYEKVAGVNPSWFCTRGGGKREVRGLDTRDFPVEWVSWEDAVGYCRRLSERPKERAAGRVYRLPTEAEWEYACRGGAEEYQVFHCGNALSSRQANFDGQCPYGGAAKGPNLARTSRVGSYEPNRFGLYDLHGNVWEWCADRFGKRYYARSPRQDPPGPSRGSPRVIRGGGYRNSGKACRSAMRLSWTPADGADLFGFRVASVLAGQ